MEKSFLNIRCSSIGYVMTEPRAKSEILSETCKTHIIDLHVAHKYNRHDDIFNKYVEKGTMVEEDSITLYSRVKKNYFKKNDKRLSNNYINGEPDLFTGIEIAEADTIIDIKSSWDLYTFFRAKYAKVNPHYYWQLQGYMALTGASKSTLAYCLVNTPEVIIGDEKRKLMYRMDRRDESDILYVKACEEMDKNMRFDDIPIADRFFEFDIPRDDEAIGKIYKRIDDIRTYYDKTFNLSNVVIASCDTEVNAMIV